MRALQYSSYGALDRLALRDDVPEPAPRPGRIVVRVRRAALNPKDALFRKGKFRVVSGRAFPKFTGLDFSGEVLFDPTGAFVEGDRVFGTLDEWTFGRGTLAQQVSVRPREVARLPDDVDPESGAAVGLCGLTALQALRDDARLGPGARVLIHGASGGLGTAAIQVARLLGAREVTSVSSSRNLELCASLGATTTLDYEKDEFLSRPGVVHDCVFDAFGTLTLTRVRGALSAKGVFVSAIPTPWRLMKRALATLLPTRERLVVVRPNRDDLDRLARWLTRGRLRTVIDSRFPLARAHEAFARLETKRARGKIVVEIP